MKLSSVASLEHFKACLLVGSTLVSIGRQGMANKNGDGLGWLQAIIGVASLMLTAYGYVKRTTCSCCGASLPLFGDSELLGTRFCPTCRHPH